VDDSSDVFTRDILDDDGNDDKSDGKYDASVSFGLPSGAADVAYFIEQSALDSLPRSEGDWPIGIVAQKETEIELCL
jgi:hypothetical protein